MTENLLEDEYDGASSERGANEAASPDAPAGNAETPIRRHVKVQGRRTPYDGDEVYWSTRLGHYPAVKPRTARLLKQQQGKCRACGYRLKMGDVLEVDHILARAQGGKDEAANWQLLHRYCHMEKTAQERRRYACQAPHA